MKLIFAGTPSFAAAALEALLQQGHEVSLVLTQPDRPRDRGLKLKPSPVKLLALAYGLPVEQPSTLATAELQTFITNAAADLMVVAAYGLMLPEAVLAIPRLGCVNIHASLLPRWRGAAPIQRALDAGDRVTGITIMQMDAGLDSGDIISTHPLIITEMETGASLYDKLTVLGAQAIVATLSAFDELIPQPQPAEGVTYAAKLTKSEAKINWQCTACQIAQRIRAFNSVPGAYTLLDGKILKLWMAHAVAGVGAPGRVVAADANAILVGCCEGLVAVTELQFSGGKRLLAHEFNSGYPGLVGSQLTD